MVKYYVQRVGGEVTPEWEVAIQGEDPKCKCEDPVFAYLLVDLLNDDLSRRAAREPSGEGQRRS